MDPAAIALRDALLAAYRPYLSRIAESYDVAEAIGEGEGWLGTALDDLLGMPFVAQARGPLELFQESLRFVTRALESAQVERPTRQRPDETAVPGDIYGLAPASSQDLGEEAWQAHIAWGATKAAALTTVAWFGRDLADRSKLEAAASAAGLRLVVTPDDLATCGRVVVDLTYPGADDVLGRALGTWPVVAYGPHVDVARLDAAAAGGATAVSRGKFFADPASFLKG